METPNSNCDDGRRWATAWSGPDATETAVGHANDQCGPYRAPAGGTPWPTAHFFIAVQQHSSAFVVTAGHQRRAGRKADVFLLALLSLAPTSCPRDLFML